MSIFRKGLAFSVVTFLWLFVSAAAVVSSFAANQIYSYIDDSGTQTFTTDLESVPEKFRNRLVRFNSESVSPADSGAQQAASKNLRVVTASGEYRMGDHDTRADAVRLAVEAAKRAALEQVATYLESVTEVKNLDVTRDDIRTYTAGVVLVLDQKISTRVEGNSVVIQADLTAQVDPDEVAQAITALRENESAKHELAALRTETDDLHRQLDAANEALAAAPPPDQVQTLNQQRQDLLNQLQANALVSQAWTDWIVVTPIVSPYPWIGVQQVNGLLLQARQLHPHNRHLLLAQQAVRAQPGVPVPAPGVAQPMPPHASLLVPPTAAMERFAPPPHQGQSLGTRIPAPPMQRETSPPIASERFAPPMRQHQSLGTRTPAPPMQHETSPPAFSRPQRFSAPLPPTIQQTYPRHLAQPNPPVFRAPFSAPRSSPQLSPQHFGGTRGHGGGGGRSGRGGGHRGR